MYEQQRSVILTIVSGHHPVKCAATAARVTGVTPAPPLLFTIGTSLVGTLDIANGDSSILSDEKNKYDCLKIKYLFH